MGRERHRVAVVVFAECDGADYHDAAQGVVMSLDHLLREGGILGHAYRPLPSPPRRDGRSWETTIADVMNLDAAIQNGYIFTRPTYLAFPRPAEESHEQQG